MIVHKAVYKNQSNSESLRRAAPIATENSGPIVTSSPANTAGVSSLLNGLA